MGNLISAHPVATTLLVICGIIVLVVLGYLIYKIVTRKKFDYDKFENDNNTNDELSTKTSTYAKIQNSI